MNTKLLTALWLSVFSALSLQPLTAFAQGTAFGYQGRLNDGEGLANGIYEFEFSLYDDGTAGRRVAGPITRAPVTISNGFFSVTLDFGDGTVFSGPPRWLEISVRTSGGGAFTTLAPRQQITASPYSITAGNLTGPVATEQITGTLNSTTLPSGGNWALNSTLTLDSGTLAIDPATDWVGIGTSTPTAPLTIRPSSSLYGLEHTDGTHRLTTYLDASGCWLGTISHHNLLFFVKNNAYPSMTLDLDGRLGLGTSSPVDSLHVVQGLGSVRLDSTANPNGSVLELRNTMISPNYLGAINFNDAGGTYPGQIGYLVNHDLVFRTGNTERMRLDNNGILGVQGSIRLDAADAPMIVRQWDPFTGGNKTGLGRWGLFMEPNSLFLGVPGTDYGGTSSIKFGGWLADGNRQNWMTIQEGGNVGIGTSTPAEALHVERPQATVRIMSTNSQWVGSVLQLVNTRSNFTGTVGQIVMSDGSGRSAGVETASYQGLPFLQVFVGEETPASFTTSGTQVSGEYTPLIVNRKSSDGLLVRFQRDEFEKGSITVSGETVSYNAFTGSHYAWSEQVLHRGHLVRMTGVNHRFGDSGKGEVVYGVLPTARANDSACLGAYLSLQEPAQPAGAANPHLVMAVGNGELWVAGSGDDIEPGDSLISSDVAGCAMKHDPTRFAVGHVVARAAERIVWSAVAPDADGVKRRLTSVLFDRFTRGLVGQHSDSTAVAAVQRLNQHVEEQRAELKRKQMEITELQKRLSILEQHFQSVQKGN
jgi:hypothetical protein